jgi:hypothetical protein
MVKITHFSQSLHQKIPQTIALLQNANLVVHPLVTQVTLHGSRSLGGHPRPDSDIDLSLLVKSPNPPHICTDLGSLFAQILALTLEHWRGSVEPDLALVFPLHRCGLRCFQFTQIPASPCAIGGLNCFGIYKMQKGFSGFVLNAGVRVEKLYPCLTIWRKYEQSSWII